MFAALAKNILAQLVMAMLVLRVCEGEALVDLMFIAICALGVKFDQMQLCNYVDDEGFPPWPDTDVGSCWAKRGWG